MAEHNQHISTTDFENARQFVASRQTGAHNVEKFRNLERIVIYAQSCARPLQSEHQASGRGADNRNVSSSENIRHQANEYMGYLNDCFDKLENKNESLERANRDQEGVIRQIQESNNDITLKFGEQNDEVMRLEQIIQEKNTENSNLKMRYDEQDENMKKLEKNIEQKNTENNGLRMQIGKILNDQTDPMKTERISDTVGRPSVIKLKYETLTTQDAANLRTSIRKPDNVSDEFWKFFVIQTVCGLLQVSWNEMKKYFEELVDQMSQLLVCPLGDELVSNKSKTSGNALPADLIKRIREVLLSRAEDVVCIDQLIENVIDTTLQLGLSSFCQNTNVSENAMITMHQLSAHIKKHKDIRLLVKSSCLLAWQMVLQNPMMRLTTEGIGDECNPTLHDVIPHSSASNKVLYYLAPVMVHGDNVLIKGRVKLGDYTGTISKMLMSMKPTTTRDQNKYGGPSERHHNTRSRATPSQSVVKQPASKQMSNTGGSRSNQSKIGNNKTQQDSENQHEEEKRRPLPPSGVSTQSRRDIPGELTGRGEREPQRDNQNAEGGQSSVPQGGVTTLRTQSVRDAQDELTDRRRQTQQQREHQQIEGEQRPRGGVTMQPQTRHGRDPQSKLTDRRGEDNAVSDQIGHQDRTGAANQSTDCTLNVMRGSTNDLSDPNRQTNSTAKETGGDICQGTSTHHSALTADRSTQKSKNGYDASQQDMETTYTRAEGKQTPPDLSRINQNAGTGTFTEYSYIDESGTIWYVNSEEDTL